MKQLVLVFIGGGTGSIARFLIGKLWNSPATAIPFGTFAANVIGSVFIGLIMGWALKQDVISTNTTLLLATGFCGGFTTFSTFAYENQLLLKSGDFLTFAIYTIASFALGIAAVFLGLWLSKIMA